LNTGELHVRGLDFAIGRALSIGSDRIDLDVSGSWLFDYDRKLTPTATREALLDQVGYPVDLRLKGGATWSRDAWSTRIGFNYVDAYRDPLGPRVDRWITADTQIRWAPASLLGVRGVDIALNVKNLFDADPPFYDSASGYGYDAAQADPLGRVVSLQLTRRW